MESRKQQFHNTVPTVETPVFVSTTLPTNCVQFPSSTWLSLGSASALGNVFSVPMVGHPLVSPIQQKQQLLMQSEPLILLPASALSFSAHSDFVVSTSSLSPTIQPILSNQQLHQIPLILKPSGSSLQQDHTCNLQEMNQQFIVLPVGEGDGNPSPILEQISYPKSVSEHKIVLGDEGNLSDRKNDCACKQDIIRNLIAEKSESKTKIKIRKNTKVASETKPDSSAESSVLETSNSELHKLDITQIISSIPSGWKVVGVTGLDKSVVRDIVPSSKLSSSLIFSDIQSKVSNGEAHFEEVKSEVSLLAEEITPHDQPSLVSVNLNTVSQPFASETVFDKWQANELTCSVKMDDIPCTHVISIKTECTENNEDNAVDRLNCKHVNKDKEEPTIICEKHICPCSTKVGTKLQSQESGRKAAGKSCCSSQNDLILQESTKKKSSDCTCTETIPTDSKWTIIGITSLSPFPTTSTMTTSSAGMPTLESSCSVYAETSSPSNITILNIPSCHSTASHADEEKNTTIYNKKALHKSRNNSPSSSMLNEVKKSSPETDFSTKIQPEDMKWTIVGVMGSPLTNTSSLNPGISPGSEFLRNSYPVTSCSLTPTMMENVVSNQLLNILSPLSNMTTSPILLSTEQISPNPQGKRKSKPQDTVKKSPQAHFSTNNEDPNQGHCTSQSQDQWKIVGVTQLGIPPTATSSIVSVSQLNPISPVMSTSLLVPASSGALFSQLTAQATNMGTQTTNALPSGLLPAMSTLPSLFSQPALPFPVFNLNGTSCNSTMTLSSPALIDPASPAGIHTLPDLSQQRNLNQLIQSQLTTCQNPISMLAVNETNQWNVIGVVANNQVSMLNHNQGNPPVVNTITSESKLSPQEAVSHISVTSTQNIKSKQNISNSDTRRRLRETAANKNATIRQSLASKQEDSDNKRDHIKSKDPVNKNHQEPTKIKKNTVSNLLRIKRMRQGQVTCENGSSDDEDNSFEEYHDFTDTSYEVPSKKTKTRSLRSYAGNRKIFTRRQNKAVDEKINVRSATQIQIVTSKSDDDDDDDNDVKVSPAKIDEKVIDTVVPVKETQNDDKYTGIKIDMFSSSRRRKLKVPRKLIADLDYHPFDSSSDSN